MFGERVFVANGGNAEGDKGFFQIVYNDTTGSLTIGMPIYADCTDAAEYNGLNNTTKLSPAAANTGGYGVLGTNTDNVSTNLVFIGVFASNNPSAKPAKGDAIRCCVFGRYLASAVAVAAGTAVLVGDWLNTTSTQTGFLSGHVTFTAGVSVAQAFATGTAVAKTNSIIAVPGSSQTQALINAFIFGL